MEQISSTAPQQGILQENSPCQARGRVGFKITHLEKVVYHAVRQAYDYVIMAREKGAQIRTWVIAAKEQTNLLVSWAEDFEMNGLGSKVTKEEIENKINELGTQESLILRVVHKYLNETNEIRNKLGLLNPPLTSNQLHPFLNALAEDKRRTIASLEGLTNHLERLNQLKIAIFRDLRRFSAD